MVGWSAFGDGQSAFRDGWSVLGWSVGVWEGPVGKVEREKNGQREKTDGR